MAITITTETGSRYVIQEKKEKILISKGAFLEAELVKIRSSLRVGEKLEADIRKYSIYGQPQKDLTYIRTGKIVRIDTN